MVLVSSSLAAGILFKALEHPDFIQKAHANPLAAQPENRPAAAFSLPDREGRSFRLSEFGGKSVLLNFWATWCKPCQDELPGLAVLARKLQGRSVHMVLVSVDDEWAAVEKLAEGFDDSSNSGEAPEIWRDTARLLRGQMENVKSLIDPTKKIAENYGTTKFPETYLIGPDGRIIYRFIGPKLWAQPDALDFMIKSIDFLTDRGSKSST